MSAEGVDPSVAKSRAGRNLPAAIASGVALGAVVLVSLFTLKWIFGIVVIAAILIAGLTAVAAVALTLQYVDLRERAEARTPAE